MAEHASTIPGWFGKLPFLGDFASRRLPQAFIEPWDSWLQRCIALSRAQLGEQWLDIYLHSPICRFVLLPGVIGPQGWAGTMMPSVDNVGRYFPLTIATEISAGNFMTLFAAGPWFLRLEQIMLSTLDTKYSVDDLERELMANPLPAAIASSHGAAVHSLHAWLQQSTSPRQIVLLQSPQELPVLLNGTAMALLNSAAYGRSIWWFTDPSGEATLCGFAGMPSEQDFAHLLRGEFAETSQSA